VRGLQRRRRCILSHTWKADNFLDNDAASSRVMYRPVGRRSARALRRRSRADSAERSL